MLDGGGEQKRVLFNMKLICMRVSLHFIRGGQQSPCIPDFHALEYEGAGELWSCLDCRVRGRQGPNALLGKVPTWWRKRAWLPSSSLPASPPPHCNTDVRSGDTAGLQGELPTYSTAALAETPVALVEIRLPCTHVTVPLCRSLGIWFPPRKGTKASHACLSSQMRCGRSVCVWSLSF